MSRGGALSSLVALTKYLLKFHQFSATKKKSSTHKEILSNSKDLESYHPNLLAAMSIPDFKAFTVEHLHAAKIREIQF